MGMQDVLLADFFPLLEGKDQYPLEFIENNYVIKLKEEQDSVFIGVCDSNNLQLLEMLKSFHEKEVRFLGLAKNDLSIYIGKKMADIGINDSFDIMTDDRILLDRLANDAPIVNLVNSMILEALSKKASDIHIESFSDYVAIRYRIDGILHLNNRLNRNQFQAVSCRIKIMANLNIMERRLPQDGRTRVTIGDREVDLRVSIVPIAEGESIVIRLFNHEDSPQNLDDLGFSDKNKLLLEQMISTPHGLFLITGATGSGKSTTLAAILRKLNNEEYKIISIEDPIENQINGIAQIQTHDKIGLTFSSILRRVLRQDPDVIMVGEIRDKETAELSLRAALTGHLVFSTLHTNDSISVIGRLMNMGVEPFLIASVLRGACAQRLIRRLCPHCKGMVAPSIHERDTLGSFGVSLEGIYHPVGCKLCNQTGYLGRIALFEGFQSCEELERLIAHNATYAELKAQIVRSGGTSLFQDGIEKIAGGLTTLKELEKVTI